jgi:high-affinity iron transporter
MLPTLVIGLREGLEASLIVGIIAAFLVKQRRRDVLRWCFVGVASGVLICVAVGVALRLVSQNLPQRQQEGLETVIGAVAVLMVTYMVIWMKRHSRDLKGQLEGATSSALAAGSGLALVVMAFLAVLREGFETVVFLLAAFNESDSGVLAGVGALLGITGAIALGYAIYRGGVRLNLSRFFRATGLVLVLVAGGLVVNALHTAHEASWLDVGQQATLDLSALVRPGSVQASLLTGMLGLQAHPVLIELVGWLLYVVPVGLYVAWPPGHGVARAALGRVALAGGVGLGLVAVLLAVLAPGRPSAYPALAADGVQAQVRSISGDDATIRATVREAAHPEADPRVEDLVARHVATETHDGLATEVYAAVTPVDTSVRGMSLEQLAERNGGRLPLGVRADSEPRTVAVRVDDTVQTTLWAAPQTGRIVDVQWVESSRMSARLSTTQVSIDGLSGRSQLAPAAAADAVVSARQELHTADRHRLMIGLAVTAGVLAAVACSVALAVFLAGRRESRAGQPTAIATAEPVKS